jgi:hemoglobin
MIRILIAALVALALAAPAFAQEAAAPAPAPIKGTPAENAGAKPFEGDGMWKAFHEQAGVTRIVDRLIDASVADPKIGDIFKGHEVPKLKKLLVEQFCYLLNGPCTYSGRDMKTAHKDMGLQMADFNRLVELLQVAMDQEHIAFRDQNRFLAKLAPMERTTVER